jgi:hypothetical protein
LVSLEDRIGLVSDTTALAQAGMAKTSSSLSLIKSFAWEQKCMLTDQSLSNFLNELSDLGCQAMSDACTTIAQVFGEYPQIRAGMKEFRRAHISTFREVL